MKNRSLAINGVKYLLIIIASIVVAYPFILCLLNSFKLESEIFINMFGLPTKLNIQNYIGAWKKGFQIYYKNTIVITAFAVAISLSGSLLIAFVLTRRNLKFRGILYALLIIGMTIPAQISATPTYILMNNFGLINTLSGLVLIFTAYRLPFTTFIIFGYFKGIPYDIEESAIIDGCTTLQVLMKIYLPLSKSIISAGFIFSLVSIWNNFFFPLLLTSSPDKKTIAVGLMQFQGQYRSSFTSLFAGSIIATLPVLIVYFLFQKQFMRGMTAGAVKG